MKGIKLRLTALLLSCTALHTLGQNQLIKSTDTSVYTMVPMMPDFGNDNAALQNFIVKEARYPVTAKRTSTSKKVFVQVIIEKDGGVTFDKIAHGYNEKFDAEARRIVSKMPNWSIPKLATGEPARVYIMFPIWFE
jgi:hypothetical protein